MNFITIVFRFSLNPAVISVTIFNIIIFSPTVTLSVGVVGTGRVTILIGIKTDAACCKH